MANRTRCRAMLIMGIGTLVILACAQPCFAAAPSLRSQVNLATLRVTNPKSSATVFVFAPDNEQEQPQPLILVTSAHVFEKAEGDEMRLTLRKRDDEGEFSKVEVPLKIRHDGKNLWTKHPKEDVATLSFLPPEGSDVPRLSLSDLANRETLESIEPGDIVRSFGFPHAPLFDPTAAAFPTVRLGCIAGYPTVPTKKQPHLLIDCNTFEGDSGGPVVWQADDGAKPAKVIGLIQGQHFINFNYDFPYQSGAIRKQLGVAIVIPSLTIRETIDAKNEQTSKSK